MGLHTGFMNINTPSWFHKLQLSYDNEIRHIPNQILASRVGKTQDGLTSFDKHLTVKEGSTGYI